MSMKANQLGPAGKTQDQRTLAALSAGNGQGLRWPRSDDRLNQVTTSELENRSIWDMLGSAVNDATYASDAVVFGERVVHFKTPAGWATVPYVGPPLSCETGGKRVATTDLGAVAERIGAIRVPGGGLPNSVKELARLRREKRLPYRFRAINASATWPALEEEFAGLGIEHLPLGLIPAVTNLILTNGGGPMSRWILKSPTPSPIALNGEWNRVVECEGEKPSVLLINSARPEDLVRVSVVTRSQQGTRIYSLATPSIPVDARIKLLLANSRVTQFNLEEFVEVADALGIKCPLEEKLTAVPGVGAAIKELVLTLPFPARDLVVTIGQTGMLLYDSSHKGCICHVRLSQEALAITQNYLRRDKVNGIGDRTFAALVMAYETVWVAPESSRLVRAACQAWADVLQGAGPFLQPKPTWFQVRVLACECFGMKWTELPLMHIARSDVSWPEQAL